MKLCCCFVGILIANHFQRVFLPTKSSYYILLGIVWSYFHGVSNSSQKSESSYHLDRSRAISQFLQIKGSHPSLCVDGMQSIICILENCYLAARHRPFRVKMTQEPDGIAGRPAGHSQPWPPQRADRSANLNSNSWPHLKSSPFYLLGSTARVFGVIAPKHACSSVAVASPSLPLRVGGGYCRRQRPRGVRRTDHCLPL